MLKEENFLREFLRIGSLLRGESGINGPLYHSSDIKELLRGKAVSMESRWMLNFFLVCIGI